jgi:hypothetical protein
MSPCPKIFRVSFDVFADENVQPITAIKSIKQQAFLLVFTKDSQTSYSLVGGVLHYKADYDIKARRFVVDAILTHV